MAAVSLPPVEQPANEIEIVRATTRFALDLRKLSAVPSTRGQKRELSAEEKDVRRALEAVSRLATTARNAAMRALFRRDSDALDAFLAQSGGEMPRGKGVEYPKSYSYPLIRRTVPTLASGMAATLSKEVDSKWTSERYSVLIRQEKSAPHYRVGQPFPVRAQDVQWTWGDGGAVALVTLWSGGSQGENVDRKRGGSQGPVPSGGSQASTLIDRNGGSQAVAVSDLSRGESQVVDPSSSGGSQAPASGAPPKYRLPIVARDEHQAHVLKMLASGEWKAGEIKIERDRLTPAKWYLRVSYKRKVPLRIKGQDAAVCLGMRAFLVAVTEDGGTWVYDGNDIASHLLRTQAQRRSFQRGIKASARVGHGRPRALKSIEFLTGKGERYRQTRNAVLARRLATWLRQQGVARVHLGDFTGIRNSPPETLATKDPKRQQWIWERVQEWPYFDLSTRIKSALESPVPGEAQEAIETFPTEQDFHSQRCPGCGVIDPANRNFSKWLLKCKACGYCRHLDVAQCANTLARSRGEVTRFHGDKENGGLRGPEGGGKGSARKPGRK